MDSDNMLYRVYRDDGSFYSHFRLEDTLEYYNNNKEHCVRIDARTKDLFPKVYTIVNDSNFNVERIREDLTIKNTSEARRKANAKYDKKTAKGLYLKLNAGTDADIIELLNETENKQGLIKELLREYKRKKLAS